MIPKDYQPEPFSKFSPESEVETGAKNLVLAAKLKSGDVIVRHPVVLKTIECVRAELKEKLEEVRLADDVLIYTIKCPTGSGKTQQVLHFENALIASPTHKLSRQSYERAKAHGYDVLITPEIPHDIDPSIRQKIDELYQAGAHRAAMNYIKEMAAIIPQLEEYVEQMAEIENAGTRTVFTTHERLLSMRHLKPLIVIDEDPFKSLMKQGWVSKEELIAFLRWVGANTGCNRAAMSQIFEGLAEGSGRVVHQMPKSVVNDIDDLESAVIKMRTSSNVIGFLHSDCFVVNGSRVNFITRRELPAYKKIIILSATANEGIYRRMFGDRLRFTDLGLSELRGRVIQYPQWSGSKQCFRNDPEFVGIMKHIVGDMPVITTKEMSERFVEGQVVASFGALAGLDHLGGQDLAICGTFHMNPVAHVLFANALDAGVGFDECIPRMCRVEHDGLEFYFNSYEHNEMLRELQLYLVESEQTQAIGRARLVNHDATVLVFSNLPVRGAEYRYLTADQRRELVGD